MLFTWPLLRSGNEAPASPSFSIALIWNNFTTAFNAMTPTSTENQGPQCPFKMITAHHLEDPLIRWRQCVRACMFATSEYLLNIIHIKANKSMSTIIIRIIGSKEVEDQHYSPKKCLYPAWVRTTTRTYPPRV
jgi:hypothetical protein